jgi:hypothetical protein
VHIGSSRDRAHLTDVQRDQIDAECKSTLRDLAASVQQLEDARQIWRTTEAQIAAKRRARQNPFGEALGRWAAGGNLQSRVKSPEELEKEAAQATLDGHRESVIWYLRWRLGIAAEFQRDMMETRIQREVEKSKSVLYKVKNVSGSSQGETSLGQNASGAEFERTNGISNSTHSLSGKEGPLAGFNSTNSGARVESVDRNQMTEIENSLSPEQLQLFSQENNDMLKRYEDTLDQIR